MRSFPVHLGRGLGVVVGLALTAAAPAQPPAAKAPPAKAPAGSVHRIVLFQGPNRSVHYVTSGDLSTADRLAAFDLGRAENELTYVENLQQLKHQYVASELVLEPQRRYVQELLYGSQITASGFGMSYGSYGYGGYGGYSPLGWGGYGWGGYGRPVAGFAGSASSSMVRSLQFGVGNEGSLKNALVPVIARDAAPEYGASAVRAYEVAAGRAASSAVLSRDLGLHQNPTLDSGREPSFPKGGKVNVWVGSEKYVGTVKEDRPGWVVLQTEKGEVTIRKSEITRSETTGK